MPQKLIMTLGAMMHNEPDEIRLDFIRLRVDVFEEATGRI
jgi:hypothetical protein